MWDEAQSAWIVQDGVMPEVYSNQVIKAASGAYDGKMIVSGMFDSAEHTADTYLYDSETKGWTTLGVKLADTKVYHAAGTVCGDYFYVYGNTQLDNTTADIFCRYKVRESVEPNPEPEEKPEVTFSDVSKKSVNTGDSNHIWLLLLAMGISTVVMVCFCREHRKK